MDFATNEMDFAINEFEYTNDIFDKEVNLIIKSITKELISLKQNKENLVKFAFLESIKGKLFFFKFQRIINETQRMSVEIEFLEAKRRHYIKIKQNKK